MAFKRSAVRSRLSPPNKTGPAMDFAGPVLFLLRRCRHRGGEKTGVLRLQGARFLRMYPLWRLGETEDSSSPHPKGEIARRCSRRRKLLQGDVGLRRQLPLLRGSRNMRPALGRMRSVCIRSRSASSCILLHRGVQPPF